MSLPWESGPPPTPAPPPASTVPVVARNPETGEQVRVDVSEDLREAIKSAINDTVFENRPTLARVAVKAKPHLEGAWRGGFFTDRTLLQGAAIDICVFLVAAVSTYVSPDSGFSKGAWVAAAVLAAKTVIQAGVSFAMKVEDPT
jgi:hypothetical protein